MANLASEKVWHRTIFIVATDEPLPDVEAEALSLAATGLWRCEYFHPTLKAWQWRGWRGLPVPEVDEQQANELNNQARACALEGEAMVLHPFYLDRYVRLWDLEREVLSSHIDTLCVLARRRGARQVSLRRVTDNQGQPLDRFLPLREAVELELPVEDPRFLLGVGAPLPAFRRCLPTQDEDRLFARIKPGTKLGDLAEATRMHARGTFSFALSPKPFLTQFDELSLALARLGCRPRYPRMMPGWRLAQNITWWFDIDFDGGAHA